MRPLRSLPASEVFAGKRAQGNEERLLRRGTRLPAPEGPGMTDPLMRSTRVGVGDRTTLGVERHTAEQHAGRKAGHREERHRRIRIDLEPGCAAPGNLNRRRAAAKILVDPCSAKLNRFAVAVAQRWLTVARHVGTPRNISRRSRYGIPDRSISIRRMLRSGPN